MRDWEPESWMRDWTFSPAPLALFVHTPLCGTCLAAGRMLTVATELVPETPVVRANLNAMPEMAQLLKIESVPCLIIKRKSGSWSKHYRFPSVVELVELLRKAREDL